MLKRDCPLWKQCTVNKIQNLRAPVSLQFISLAKLSLSALQALDPKGLLLPLISVRHNKALAFSVGNEKISAAAPKSFRTPFVILLNSSWLLKPSVATNSVLICELELSFLDFNCYDLEMVTIQYVFLWFITGPSNCWGLQKVTATAFWSTGNRTTLSFDLHHTLSLRGRQ